MGDRKGGGGRVRRRGALRLAASYVGDGRRLLLLGFGFIVVDALAQTLAASVFRDAFNLAQTDPTGFVDGGWHQVALGGAAVALSYLVSAYIAHTQTRIGAARWAANLRRGVYDQVQRLSMDFFHRYRTGEVTSRITQDVDAFESAVMQGLGFTWAAVVLIVGVGLMLWIDVGLALAALALMAVAAAWTLFFLPRLRRRSRALRDKVGDSTSTITEFLSAAPLIKALNAEAIASEQVGVNTEALVQRIGSFTRFQYVYSDLLGMHMVFVAPFVLLLLGCYDVAHGTLHVGDVVAIWAIWQRAAGALTGLLNTMPDMLLGLAAASRFGEVLSSSPSVRDRPDARAACDVRGDLRFEGVSFAYPLVPDALVLDVFDLHLPAGSRTALIGPSGSGKSTVAQLLLRFYDPSSGRVLLDGQDLTSLRQASVRDVIGVVQQENVMLAGTIADNLRLARPGATDGEMRVALEAAHAWEFVERLEGGLDAAVGERGATLSGGQRQRLAIARLLIKDPRVVILDEATSALDPESEQLVLAAFERLLTGRTALVIAHRMTTVRTADRIVILDGGRITAAGTHEELLETSHRYRSYVATP